MFKAVPHYLAQLYYNVKNSVERARRDVLIGRVNPARGLFPFKHKEAEPPTQTVPQNVPTIGRLLLRILKCNIAHCMPIGVLKAKNKLRTDQWLQLPFIHWIHKAESEESSLFATLHIHKRGI